MATSKVTIINWTTDERMLQLLALGIENLDNGNDRVGRSYLGAMGKGISFRSLKLREAQAAKSKGRKLKVA